MFGQHGDSRVIRPIDFVRDYTYAFKVGSAGSSIQSGKNSNSTLAFPVAGSGATPGAWWSMTYNCESCHDNLSLHGEQSQ